MAYGNKNYGNNKCHSCGYGGTWPSRHSCYQCGKKLVVPPAKPRKPQGAWATGGWKTGNATGEWGTAGRRQRQSGEVAAAIALDKVIRSDTYKGRPQLAGLVQMQEADRKEKAAAKPVHVRARDAQKKVTKMEDQIRRCEERMAGLSEQREKIDIQLAEEQDGLHSREAELARLRAECNAFDNMPTARCHDESLESYLGARLGPNVPPETQSMLDAFVKFWAHIAPTTFEKHGDTEDDEHMGDGQSDEEEEEEDPPTSAEKRSVWMREISTQELEDERAELIFKASKAQSKETSAVAARVADIEAIEQRIARSKMLDAADKVDVVEVDDEDETRGRSRDKSKSRSPKGKQAETGQASEPKPLAFGPKVPLGKR
jgi:hypothetical protein